MPIRHTTIATFADEPGAEINKAEWNADHTAPDIADVTGLQAALDAKQATLVSATNIKTINGFTILGGGDLAITAAAVGAAATPIQFDFEAPIVVNPGEYLQVVAKILVGTATATEVFQWVISPNLYHE